VLSGRRDPIPWFTIVASAASATFEYDGTEYAEVALTDRIFVLSSAAMYFIIVSSAALLAAKGRKPEDVLS
jgi:hypothetical protein